ncbi:MAG: hypothetical protein RML40_09735 [Bacteroidota bacterium]|nr:hypothetical protein [Candidatus Kapabacteria bacterium]MDW8220798.1 hypothetical protein [Bacteroidota bacterium]
MKSIYALTTACIVACVVPMLSIAQDKISASTDQAQPVKKVTVGTAPTTRTSKPTKGVVISLLTFKRVTSEEASAMANKGALALMVGSRIIYVVKSDGSSAGEDLARLADAPVGVVGRTVSRGGITVLLADMIETMK